MKKILLALVIVLMQASTVQGHSGRTDAYGGHNCYVGACVGTYHYHNGGNTGGGGYTGPSDTALGRIDGADFARNENRKRIESSASVEGHQQGEEDGLAGISTDLTDNDSAEHCSQIIKFTNTPSDAYREAFQSSYTTTCIHVYNDAYRSAYRPVNLSAKKAYEANQERELAEMAGQKKAKDARTRNLLLAGVGALGSAAVGLSTWNRFLRRG